MEWMNRAGTGWYVRMFVMCVVVCTSVCGGLQGAACRESEATACGGIKRLIFDDLRGVDDCIEQLSRTIGSLINSNASGENQNKSGRAILLHGPSGTGKTSLAYGLVRAIDTAYGQKWKFLSKSAMEFGSRRRGAAAQLVRDFFEQAKAKKPCIVCIDEIDLFGSCESGGIHEECKDTLTQLWLSIEDFTANKCGIVIAKTWAPHKIDSTLSRCFREHCKVGLPDED